MDNPICIEGPVDLVDEKLMLRIPLEDGGRELASLARGIGQIEGDELCIVIQPWLAEHLRIGAGSFVVVDNIEGKFRITCSDRNDSHDEQNSHT